jgi:hypothetical protein
MRVKLKITLETPDGDKTDVISADGRDIRNYEAEFEKSFLTTETSYIQYTQLAFETMKRLGRFKGSYDVFDSQCVSVEEVPDEEPEARPTRKAHGGGSSQS